MAETAKQSLTGAGPLRTDSELAADSDRKTDLAIARKIQAAMIPRRLPALEGLDMSSMYLPCSAVGGDLFDVVQISEDVLAFLIFDVTGHGVSSALISAMAKVCFSNHIRAISSPRAVIERVNAEMINDIAADFYLTAFLGYLDLHDNKLTYSNAGHTYPLVFRRKDDALFPLRTQGTFIGIFENGFYEEQSIYLNPGDWLLLFTDGLYRIFSDNDVNEGRRRLETCALDSLRSHSADRFIEALKSRYDKVAAGAVIDDDVTAIAIEVLTQSRRHQIKEKLGFSSDEPVYLQFISYFEEMDRAVAAVLSAMDAYGYPDESIRKMKITLTELLVNAIHHGNNKDVAKKVTMGHLVDKEKTVVSIMDEGGGFDPKRIPDPTLPENLIKDCGRGLYIVHHYVDKVDFNDKGNRVTVTKNHTIA